MMDDKIRVAFRAWHDSVVHIGTEDIVEWTLDYLRSQQELAVEVHPDDAAVDRFAAAMKEKLAAARAKGRGGWDCDEPGMQQRLSDMLRDHVEKGDPRDVANFCMFLHQRGESILSEQPTAHPATTHCDNCGCDWLDNGLNPVGCPYCKQDTLRKALEDIRSLSFINSAMRPNPLTLTAMLGDIHQIADAAMEKENE